MVQRENGCMHSIGSLQYGKDVSEVGGLTSSGVGGAGWVVIKSGY